MSEVRMTMSQVAPQGEAAMMGLEKYLHTTAVPKRILELVKIRASQINGCGFCLDMHVADARKAGEDQRRLDVVAAWRETGELFDAQERAALALAEEVTLISQHGVSDDVWTACTAQFGERDLADLLLAITTINAWNRLAVTTRRPLPAVPGT